MRFSELDGARVGVWGAGREIVSLAGQLARRLPAARIVAAAFDDPPGGDVRAALGAPGADVVTAAQAVERMRRCDVVVRSPGVPARRAELAALREVGVKVTTATSLWLAEHGPSGVLAVTGSKGKSTTAALAFHLARAAGRRTALAGNVGAPALDLLDAEPAELVVLELSSYQIADLDSGPEVAVVTNLFREHSDWHGSEHAYYADKLRLLGLPGLRAAVLNARDPRLAELRPGELRPGELRPGELPPGVEVRRYGAADGWSASAQGVLRGGRLRLDASELPLRGEHNALNLCGALAGLEALGVAAPQPLARALRDFRALPHRLQTVIERDRVLWVDDSISTTPESALAALSSFPGRGVVLIAGGQDRGQDYAELARALRARGAAVIGVPTTGERIVAAARAAGVPRERALQAKDLEHAVRLARELAAPGEVALLSPAAPSYDHFRDFEQRGERFAAILARHGTPGAPTQQPRP